MNCPYCAQEMNPILDSPLLTCNGASWSPHETVIWNPADAVFQTKNIEVANWFKENGYAISRIGNNFEMRKKKRVIERIFSK